MPGATQTIEINTPRQFFFDVISDFDSYGDFLSEVKHTRTLSDDGTSAVVHYAVEIIKKVEYSLRFTRQNPEKLTWELESASLMKSNSGSWVLEELGPERTRATYTVDVAARVFVPKAVVNMLVGSTLPATLNQFKEEAERRYEEE